MPSVQLTDAFLRTLAPVEKLTEYWDKRVSGLCLRVTPGGSRTWNFRYRPKNSTSFKRMGLGHYPEVGLAQARERAERKRVEVSDGADPQGAIRAERKAQAAALTFGELADEYIRRYAQRHKASWKQDDLLLSAHVRPAWGGRPAKGISRADAAALLDEIAARAPTSANRVQSILSKLYNWAIESGFAEVNPVAVMKKRGAESARERVLSPSEIRVLWRAIGEGGLGEAIADALRFVLLTGQRPGEVAGIEIPELRDIEIGARACVEVPAARMKAKKPHVVPLAPMARAIVRERLERRCEGQGHVFASHFAAKGSISRHSLSQAMRRIIAALRPAEEDEVEIIAGLRANPPTPHDFRRTVATSLAALGVPREDRLAVLAHRPDDVHGLHYDKYDRFAEKRRALELWEDRLSEIIEDRPAGNVIKLGGRR